ncbi:alpha-galactosidase [Arsenicicoccus sp. MKL-02]|uniref:Alpha-galactosidase n=1 Tax=Arsenicicoccus cauae TaxID=2663847 RepID=A0A6I3I5D7_9MICO|nr:alpha-galactosidase [Arsenicicoccus cauae]MTB71394.1 alpha-galactosidase [Arsenicicoccus cauae]
MPSTALSVGPDQTCQVHLTSGGVSVLVDLSDARLPSIAHWGAALPDLDESEAATLVRATTYGRGGNDVDVPVRVAVLPEHHAGWTGRPGISGCRDDGSGWSPRFTVTAAETRTDAAADAAAYGTLCTLGAGTLHVTAADDEARLGLTLEIELLPTGLVRTRATVTNDGDTDYALDELALVLPVPNHANEIHDLAGHWGTERAPQRKEFTVGQHLREGRKGRTGADAAYVLSTGARGFGFRQGEVWGVHTAWSGNHRHWAERLFNGRTVIGGSELLLPGEGRLSPGESSCSPWVFGAYGDGLDAQAARFHGWLRSRPTHPQTPRKVTLNVWEAVYFDHDLARLVDLADRAAALGVERFVLDDGWFGARRDDHAGLGDWVVSPDMWPDGLGPLVDHVTALGMEFGLWFEPEMVNLDSDVARAHPEWIMATGNRIPVESRHQQVLNLGIPGAYAHVRDQMVAVLEAYDIGYLKWDHNRDLVDAGTAPTGRAGVHEQTLATYRLMAELKERFPGLEIESCSSGGARVDLAVLEHTDRVWTSDCIDPLERQSMHRWTQQLIPPELMGSHVASGASHTTGRSHSLHFRAGTAVWGHLGIEWDLARASEAELAELGDWVAFYRRHRDLLHTGAVVRLDDVLPELHVHGVVSPDRDEALFAVVCTGRAIVDPVGRMRLGGLDPARRYRVRDVTPSRPPHGMPQPPAWWPDAEGVLLRGRSLQAVGVETPALSPDELVILHLTSD